MVIQRPFPPKAPARHLRIGVAGVNSPPARKPRYNMYYVYTLKSEKDGRHYVDITSKFPSVRLIEHNQNKSRFTRGHQPWVLLDYEQFQDKQLAMKREKFLKSGQGRKFTKEKRN
ncbi:MAG: hypothetical protein COT26_02095 [Candidatus Kerfeldbacteria bacterium CG08_land_8_20_14_0_20_43_14]|uniref:GIY-YIG domain-containing protein n=1 Tax=Candidatus Kerfeldbacteria bacterium CG08_land_8_20_14_0_20_43_14 TaxID=2014246 RepID=A0A2H0YQX8_9BACT|nr:MAG: hypothetical protein COT26_02095 [Candidatus Kerfeldbacteria bacterium CG08_land_8_20_14_0_20_43_14]